MKRTRQPMAPAPLAALLIALAASVATASDRGLHAQEPAAGSASSGQPAATADPAAAAATARTVTRLEYDGAPALGLALRRLGRTARVLMIGAHPDDENTSLLATLALGRGADVAYLSLTRGEGGQNLIGPELKDALGLIRSEELLAARRLDGAGQFFSRAYDFGYSKHAEEAFLHWPRDALLDDVVAVVRTFRPDIIVSVFSGTPSDGHGQHQAAGIMAREAFEAAGDRSRFPVQLERGLRPHSPSRLYQALWRPQGDEGVRIATGTLDPLFGRSHHQIAMASRARHRSQAMGRTEPPGPREAALRLVDTRDDDLAYSPGDPLAGVPIALEDRVRETLERPGAEGVEGDGDSADSDRAAGHSGNADDADALAHAAAYDDLTAALRDDYNALEPGALVPTLVEALDRLARVEAALGDAGLHIAAERADLHDALHRAARVELDALADDETVVPGQAFELELTLWNGGERTLRIDELEPVLPSGWTAVSSDSEESASASTVAPNTLVTRSFRVRVPEDAAPTEPYFLRAERPGDMYVWPDAGSLRGRPFGPPAVSARATVELAGARFPLEREATVRVVDRARGEDRRPVRVVPAVSVSVEPGMAVLPVGRSKTFDVSVRLAAEAPDGIAGRLRLDVPDGWTVRSADSVRFGEAGQVRTHEFEVRAPADASPGRHAVRAVFETDDGRTYDRGYALVDYDHIRPRTIHSPAEARVSAFDVGVPADLRVGYIMGAGDEGPDALAQLGVDVELLGGETLASGDLDAYDVIVTGIRAYEVRDDLVAHNERLFDYVRGGGALVVQYNTYAFDTGGYAPFPLTIDRPHDRVTDEDAAVTLLDPDHRVLSWPNRITSADFDGWVQDKGLYYAHTWDDRYETLLEMHDPGDPPLRGGLLVAPMGQGTYVYTGLAFFRQLPAGVPGAYRLFANLVSLGAER